MSNQLGSKDLDLSAWSELMSRGTTNAITGLSQMLGKEVRATLFDIKQSTPEEVYEKYGGAETEVVGIYLELQEGADGHILLAYPPRIAFGLVDMLMEYELGTTQKLGRTLRPPAAPS